MSDVSNVIILHFLHMLDWDSNHGKLELNILKPKKEKIIVPTNLQQLSVSFWTNYEHHPLPCDYSHSSIDNSDSYNATLIEQGSSIITERSELEGPLLLIELNGSYLRRCNFE